MLDSENTQADGNQPVVVKKYANRRLYNTETSTYVTLDDLAQMVRSDRDFVVYDAKSGDDLTHSVLTQIIVEQESRSTGPNLLPTPFLRQLIRFYDDIGLSPMVPNYLQMSMEALAKEQERFRSSFTAPWGPATMEAYTAQVRKNLAMFEQAMRMWTPQHSTSQSPAEPSAPADGDQAAAAAEAATVAGKSGGKTGEMSELSDLRAQLADMQEKIEQLAKSNKD
ncbi:MAG: polyhydroxyalkanoate synthesis repressor PhaR [Pseudomonadota bacterium]